MTSFNISFLIFFNFLLPQNAVDMCIIDFFPSDTVYHVFIFHLQTNWNDGKKVMA